MGCQGNLQSENVAIFGILSGGSRRAREWERYGYDFAGISTYNGKPETADQERIMHHRDIYNETLKYFLHPISSLLNDPEVSEVLVNGYETVFFEKGGSFTGANAVSPTRRFSRRQRETSPNTWAGKWEVNTTAWTHGCRMVPVCT